MEKTASKKKDTKATVNWEAEEYLQRDKRAGWYIGFTIVVLVLVALSIILQWWTFTALIVLSAIALIIYSVRPPRKLHYSLTSKGLSEGNVLYSYDTFRSFGVLQDGDKFAIILTPRKRFSPRVTVYFPEESGEKIVDAFGMRLPMEEVKLDFLDKIVKLLRI
ncbi:hypothetical protein IKG06_01850 [Candidatus Saccharibacteria bacterium]|nr:hypothetical protein [Candidatus Saccharibacteria bacterium]